MQKPKILCIDDDPFYGELYRQLLENKGYEVVYASDPQAGYEAARKHRPDLIILDVMMPERGQFRDGYVLLEAFRQEDATKTTPIIMISALGSNEDIRHGMDLGASDFLPKQDMLPETLLRKLGELLAPKPQ